MSDTGNNLVRQNTKWGDETRNRLEILEIILWSSRLQWLWHVHRMDNNSIPKQTLTWFTAMERESVQNQKSPAATHYQRTCKISTRHGTTLERSWMSGHCGRAVSPNALLHVAGLRFKIRWGKSYYEAQLLRKVHNHACYQKDTRTNNNARLNNIADWMKWILTDCCK